VLELIRTSIMVVRRSPQGVAGSKSDGALYPKFPVFRLPPMLPAIYSYALLDGHMQNSTPVKA